MVENVKYDVICSEICEILDLLGNGFKDKLPIKLYNEFKRNRKTNYSPDFISKEGKIDEEKISKDTVALFTFLNYKYFLDTEEERKLLINSLKKD